MKTLEITKTTRDRLAGKWTKAFAIAALYVAITFALSYCSKAIEPALSDAKGLSFLISLAFALIAIPISFGFTSSMVKLLKDSEIPYTTMINDALTNASKSIGIFFRIFFKIFFIALIVIVFAIILIVSTSQNVNLTWDSLGFYFVLILALYAVLCVVLGIIALPYALANYALANDNSLTSKEAIEESKALMCGNKWNFIKLIIPFAIYFVLIGVVVSFIQENAPAVLSDLIEAFSSVFILPYFTCAVATFYDDLKDVKVEVVSTKVEVVKTEEPAVEENKTEE